MRIKSFYANTVEGAVAAARREMGPEAMLVESRQGATRSAPHGRVRGGLRPGARRRNPPSRRTGGRRPCTIRGWPANWPRCGANWI